MHVQHVHVSTLLAIPNLKASKQLYRPDSRADNGGWADSLAQAAGLLLAKRKINNEHALLRKGCGKCAATDKKITIVLP